MNTRLVGFRDIQGLDHISFWPLAIGWWFVITALLAIGVFVAFRILARQRRKRTWNFQVLKQLEQMQASLTPENSQTTAILLAELMRRLALVRFPRQECASLQGKNWLQWLSEKDASHFDWRKSAGVVEAPYLPPGSSLNYEVLKQSIQAAKGWVK
jgi:hypothetical protein